jgi:hypothetical protein
MNKVTTKKPVKKAAKAKKKKKGAAGFVPFHPYHIAAIAWLFFPGGSFATNVSQVTDFMGVKLSDLLPSESDAYGNLNSAFEEFLVFLNTPGNATAFAAGRASFQQLLLSMNNIWDGDASQMTAALVAAIAQIAKVQ